MIHEYIFTWHRISLCTYRSEVHPRRYAACKQGRLSSSVFQENAVFFFFQTPFETCWIQTRCIMYVVMIASGIPKACIYRERYCYRAQGPVEYLEMEGRSCWKGMIASSYIRCSFLSWGRNGMLVAAEDNEKLHQISGGMEWSVSCCWSSL